MAQAFSTVSRTAAAARSAVLAEPLRLPKYTVTAKATVALVLDGVDLAQAHADRQPWLMLASASPGRRPALGLLEGKAGDVLELPGGPVGVRLLHHA